MITLTPCNSKMLQAFGYEPVSQTLAVKFGHDRIYHYQGVPREVYEALRTAESVGLVFIEKVRGQYPHSIILDEAHTVEAMEPAV